MANTDLNVIIENLTELLTNTVNMTSVYYDLFINPEPMDVELKQFASDGTYKIVSVPNRAKDRKVALSGSGTPEGHVPANMGACYVDEENQTVYYKTSGSGNTGWTVVLTQRDLEDEVRRYMSLYLTTADLSRYLIEHHYVDSTVLSDALNQYKPITQAYTPSQTSGVINLEDNSCYAFTASGNVSFGLPDPSTLSPNQLHKILVQIKIESAITIESLGTTVYFDNIAPAFGIGSYNIMYEYDLVNNVWVVGCIKKGA